MRGLLGRVMLRSGAHPGDNRAFRPRHKLRVPPQLIQPARRGRLPILKSKRQRLRRPRQGVVQSIGGGDDAGEIGEGDAVAGRGGFVDEGDPCLCAQVVTIEAWIFHLPHPEEARRAISKDGHGARTPAFIDAPFGRSSGCGFAVEHSLQVKKIRADRN
jgi:hypothetical protein